MAYLRCDNLAIGYHGRPVVTDVTFSVGPGELLCVIGENGVGKSTLVKTLLGLLPPLGGSLVLEGGLTQSEVGYLPQQGETQRGFPASVDEIVLSGRLPRMGRRLFYRADDRRIAARALATVGASELHNHAFGTLSGGQQQRVLLARALCAAAKLIVLDEPTTGLDPEATQALYETLDKLREEGMAIVAVTHDVDAALLHASHVLVMGGGSPHFQTIDAYLTPEEEDVP